MLIRRRPADALAHEARQLAARENTRLRELIESGMRAALRERREPAALRLRDAGFRGRGLRREFRDADGERIRAAAYESRGS